VSFCERAWLAGAAFVCCWLLLLCVRAPVACGMDGGEQRVVDHAFQVILDADIDSATIQEAAEFTARTAGDLKIDSTAVVPAGALIRGRVATRAPVTRGAMSLIFDSLETPKGPVELMEANVISEKRISRVNRRGKVIAIRSKVFCGLPSGTIVDSAIGALARPADGRPSIYNPWRTFVVLSDRLRNSLKLRAGDRLTVRVGVYGSVGR
jgi:hypothetical protein